MPLQRLGVWLQKLMQWLRIMASWLVCLMFGLTFMVSSLLFGATSMWLHLRVPWARCMLRVLRVELQIEGAQHLLDPAIFIANHTSLIDVVILPAILPRKCRLVAKREVLWFPIIGLAFARGGALLLDRKNPRRAAQRLAEGAAALPKGWSLGIFPEGTRSHSGLPQRFKRGAFSLAMHTGLPIVPIGLVGAQKIIAPKTWWVNPGTVRVRVGPPIATAHWQENSLRQHAMEGEQAIARCLDVDVQLP